jgi:hypothetical protein
MLDLGGVLGHQWHGCRLAALDGLGRGSAGFLGDLPLAVCFIRRRDLAGDVALKVDPWRAGLERRPVFRALGVLLEQALDPGPAHLRVLADDLFVYADLSGRRFVRQKQRGYS